MRRRYGAVPGFVESRPLRLCSSRRLLRLPTAVSSLPHPDNLHVEAAQGWLLLGDASSALGELAQISAVNRQHLDVLETEWEIHAKLGAWGDAYQVAQRIVDSAPTRAFGWIHRAYALRRMPQGGLVPAWDALRPAVEMFPRQFLIPYNLACYAAQMGRQDEAWDWLQRAIQASGDSNRIHRMALADPDLECLWPRLRRNDPE